MRLDRLDRAALGAMAALAGAIAFLLLRGDQAGVQIARANPADGAQSVAAQARISVTFSEPMDPASLEDRIQMAPAVSGTLSWSGNTVFYHPSRALARDTQYTVTVRAGALSSRGRKLLRDAAWSFRTGHARVIYVSPAAEAGDLYAAEVAGDPGQPPQRITTEPFGVYDFAISPDGSRIAYSAARDDSGQRDLWLINTDGAGREQLVACDAQVCQSPSWAADGNRVAFERRALVQGAIGRSPGPARIWVVDTAARSASPLSSDTQRLGTLPRWAPVGDRLAYYDPLESAVAVLDTASGRTVLLPSVLGDSGAWSPDARYLVYPELEAVDAGQYSQMLRADLATDVITPVTALAAANDASIAWAPSADWIAFTRQQLRSGGRGFAAIGPQVWVSRPDGSQARQVTTDTAYSYGGLRWSPDGEWVAAVRNHLETPNPKPEVWLVRADGRERRLLASDATLPAWLP